ncbi:MAG: hypothetical protein AB1782_06560 [Cyanobacteriota bacterium]
MARSKMSPGMQIIMGVIILIAAIIIPFYTCKKVVVNCNTSASLSGKCEIIGKGLISTFSDEIITDQFKNITYQEIRKSTKGGYSYFYRIIISLADGKQAILPVEMPAADRDRFLAVTSPIIKGYTNIKIEFSYDNWNRMFMAGGAVGVLGLVMVIMGVFRRR